MQSCWKTPPLVWSAALLGLALSGCIIDEPVLEGLPCPCDEEAGYRCDPGRNVCLRGAATVCGRLDVEAGSIEPPGFRWEWSTANQIRWAWDEDLNTAATYEIVVGNSRDDVLDLNDVRIFDATSNPELLGRPDGTAGATELIDGTATDDHPPDAEVFGRLLVTSRAGGGVTCSDVVNARTTLLRDVAPTPAHLVVYDEGVIGTCECGAFSDLDVDYCNGTQNRTGEDRSFTGVAYLELVQHCYTDGARTVAHCAEAPMERIASNCLENVKIQPLDVEFAERGLDEDFFSSGAFIELAYAVESTSGVFWARPVLLPRAWPAGERWPVGPPFAPVVDGSYHIVQFPLREFVPTGRRQEPAITWEELGGGVSGFQVAGVYGHGSVVRIDSIQIRW